MTTLTTHELGQRIPATDGSQRWLYRGLSLSIPHAGLLTVVGPNGSGKTTLLRQLAGIRPATTGEVRLDGTPLRQLPVRQRARQIAYLPQTTPLYHDMLVSELVMLGRVPFRSRLTAPSALDHRAVDEALDQVGLSPFRDRSVFSLSGGEYQRVMLARLLATRADILILDEPSTALDVGYALDLLERLLDLANEGKRIVVAMHELDLARRYGLRSLCLRGRADGSFHEGPASEVLQPRILSATFGVAVYEQAGSLIFHPQTGPFQHDRGSS